METNLFSFIILSVKIEIMKNVWVTLSTEYHERETEAAAAKTDSHTAHPGGRGN